MYITIIIYKVCLNTNKYFVVFEKMIYDFANEVKMNTTAFYEIISKLNMISKEIPKVEELYFKM